MSSNFIVGPIKDGLRKDQKPWAIPEDAFETLTNAYQFRGRILRRQGYSSLGRLSTDGGTTFPNLPVMGLRTQEEFVIATQNLIAFDTRNAYSYNGSVFTLLPSVMPVTWSGANYQLFYSINYSGAFWATNSKPGLNGYIVSLFAGQAGAGPYTVNITATGNTFQLGDIIYLLNITGAGAANNLRQGTVTATGATFTLTSTDGLGAFTNGAATTGLAMSSTRTKTGEDGIRYYGSLSNAGGAIGDSWANYNPPIDPNNALAGALLIFAYRGYLVFLNTYEGNDSLVQNFPNRARWTQIGTPYYSYPIPNAPNLQTVDFLAARDDIFGRGGANDAPTSEAIVAAAFIRDVLVVYFERSTWRFRFVNNTVNPFVWERVNVELGSDCTFSSIPFDKGVMAIGTRGIVISDGNNTDRFDEKIPDDIFTIRQSNNGLYRVAGIRTFRTRLNYWTFPSDANPEAIFPDSVLVFNYETKNWSFTDDSFTCFGYYYPAGSGITWEDLTNLWPTYDAMTAGDGVTQEGYETIIAGNQQGFVFQLEQKSSINSPSLYINSITLSTSSTPTIINSPNYNLADGDWITITGVTGTTSSDGVSLNNRNFKISQLPSGDNIDQNNFAINEFASIDAGSASGSIFTYTIEWIPILAGSVQINIGASQYVDSYLDGNLYTGTTASGTLNYTTGALVINFPSPIGATEVYIRIVSVSPLQLIEPVQTITAYTGGGLIAKIPNIDIQTKEFNFLGEDKRARLSKIDFYTNITKNGQFTCNVFADSSNVPVNVPLSDNPQSNVVKTSLNPYQVPSGSETIYRLFCDAIAQTVQLQLTLSDNQMAVNAINSSNIEILSMIFTLRQGGRLV